MANDNAKTVFDDTKTSVEEMKSALADGGYPAESFSFVITPQEAKDMIDAQPGMIILDVREANEFCDEHILSSLNYPWISGVLEERYGEISVSGDILVVSQIENQSRDAAKFLGANGFTSVYEIIGGISDWKWARVACCQDLGLESAISALQVMVSVHSDNTDIPRDINGDGQTGLAEAICIMQAISGLR
ncbi:rhodanese-like domain-containing protein [Desulfobacterales bacterium HSG2]|nr:rhodanese-like domain-containing protein [Desulfobacterales bacterium HSG2]